MKWHFDKYQGTGNDFILIDDRAGLFDVENVRLIEHLCHRRFGIGADGLILLRSRDGFDFEMVYFNSDGRLSSMCGNGGRCIVAFAKALGVIDHKAYFLAPDGPHDAFFTDEGLVSLKMKPVDRIEKETDFFFLDTGSPHYVCFPPKVRELDVRSEGRAVRYSPRFAEQGTNVNFAEIRPDGSLFVRTYERGVEDETYSCGTGVTATAIAAALRGTASPVRIETPGGNLQVSFQRVTGQDAFDQVYLTGPAKKVFSGVFDSSEHEQ